MIVRRTIAAVRRYCLARMPARAEYVFAVARKMPIVPTHYGLGFFMLLGVLFIWSANHRLNLGYALIFLLLMIMLLSAVLTAHSLAQLKIYVADAPPVWAGEPAYFPLYITELAQKPRAGLWISQKMQLHWCDGIAAGATKVEYFKQETTKRGWQTLDFLQMYSTLPFGLFVSWQWLRCSARVLVYPRPAGNQPLPYDVQTQTQGTLQLSGKGEEDLAGLSVYRAGDPLSRVAWKQSARSKERLIKRFSGAAAQKVVLDFAKTRGDTEARLSQMAQWILDCEAQKISYAFVLEHYYLDFSSGKEHRDRCLQRLAEYESP